MHGQLIPDSLDSGGKDGLAPTQSELLATISTRLTSDVVGLQEVDEAQPRSGGHSQIQSIAEGMGAASWGYARTVMGTPGENWRKLTSEEKLIETESGYFAADDKGSSTSSESLRPPSYGIGLISRIPVLSWHRLELGRSPIGLPLAFPSERGVKLIYVKDEPRTVLAACLSNGYTVAVTHLSFVPFVNIYQLRKIQRWLKRLPGKPILIGDLNLPFNIPTKVSRWKSEINQNTYPSWGPKIQFDYILSLGDSKASTAELAPINLRISDHLPITVEFE